MSLLPYRPQEKVVVASPPVPAPAPSVAPPAPEPILEHPSPQPAVHGDAELASEGWEDPTTIQPPEWDDEPQFQTQIQPPADVRVTSQPLSTPEPEPVSQPEEPAAPAPQPIHVPVLSALPAQIQKQDGPTRTKSPVSLSSRSAIRNKYKGTDQAVVMPMSTGFTPGLDKIGMQFGSLSLGGDVIEPAS
jgi:hypothetical protein